MWKAGASPAFRAFSADRTTDTRTRRWDVRMILYFTGTGNTYDAARIISEVNDDALVSIGEKYKADDFTLDARQGEDLGIVFPVYRWSTPRIVDEFLRKAEFRTDDGKPFSPGYCYAVDVYGYFPGAEVSFLDSLLRREHGIALDASFEVPSVANCIYVSNPPKPEAQKKQTEREEDVAVQVAERIAKRQHGLEAKGNPVGRLLSKATGTEEKLRPIKQFTVDLERCTSCGTCARICPTNTIVLQDGHPIWQGDDCTECLACVHRCPTEAIDYGKISRGRRRYVNPALAEA